MQTSINIIETALINSLTCSEEELVNRMDDLEWHLRFVESPADAIDGYVEKEKSMRQRYNAMRERQWHEETSRVVEEPKYTG